MGRLKNTSIDVVVPLYNDQEVVRPLCSAVFSELEFRFKSVHLILVDDGSSDSTFQIAEEIAKQENRIRLVRLAGNFGQHQAISAGLTFADSDLVAVMDSDLQDRPEDIIRISEQMFKQDVPMAIARSQIRSSSIVKRLASRLFSVVSNLLVPFKVDPGLGAFRVMDRSIVNQLNSVKESTGTPFSLLYSLNIPFAMVDVERRDRVAGRTGYTFVRSMRLAMNRIMTYSITPLRLSIIMGVSSGLFSLGIAVYTILNFVVLDKVAPGWTSIAFLTSFFAGLNLLFLGIIGEYIGRIYLESRGVPRYVIRLPSDETE
jgi:dolichol-phosphate mannosyltransferase